MSDFVAWAAPRARKQHACDWCGEPIERGDKHVRESGVWDGYAFRFRLHGECQHAMAANPCRDDRTGHDPDEACDYCTMGVLHERGAYEDDDGIVRVYGPIDWSRYR